jgi:drug/metabolite transporter (DMT)-like permease
MRQASSFAMTPHISHRWAYALLILTPALWSVNYIVARLAPGWIAPHMLALCRWAIAGLVLCVFAWPELRSKRHLIRQHAWHYLVFGGLGMWICGAWVYLGARTTGATNIALIYSLTPVFVALCASLWLHEKLRALQWLGIVLAFAGLVHVVIKGQWMRLLDVQWVAGDLWILACAVSWAVYSLLLKRWPSDFSPLARLVLIITGGCLILVPLTILEAQSAQPLNQTLWTPQTLLLVLAAGLLPGAGAYWAYGVTVKALGAARSSAMLYLGPLYAALVGWLFLGESVSLYHAVGAGLIFPGLYLASINRPS